MTDIDRRRLVFAGVALAAQPLVGAASAAEPAPAAPLKYPFVLPPLGYAFNANEASIDAQTMELHHDKHHAAYVANLNKALADHTALHALTLPELLQKLDSAPEAVRAALRNHGGGHANHAMFWQVMGGAGGEPKGDVAAAVEKAFGGFEKMKAAVNAAGLKIFGSGWVMVLVDKDGGLSLASRPNQDSPWMEGKAPLFGNDVWEHAYYLKYQNRRADYLAAWWNVLNWDAIAARYAAARAGTLAV